MGSLALLCLLGLGAAQASDDVSTPYEPRVVIHLAQARLGGSGVSWNAGPAVDFRVSPHWSLGGSALLVSNGYLGVDADLTARLHGWRFERGLYGQAGIGGASIISGGSSSVSGRVELGPAWRFQLGRPPEAGLFGVIDLGFVIRAEAGMGGVPLEGATVGGAIEIAGGLGL
jgi:hypothetical protein